MHRVMAKVQALFLLLVYSSWSVFSLELETILPQSPLLSPQAHPPPHHHDHHHPHAPAKPPTHHYPLSPSLAKPPTHHIYTAPPPFHSHPLFVVVQGLVYIKSCKHMHAGGNYFSGATPVVGASVKLECNITSNPLIQTVKTNKNGYFYIEADKSITTNESHKCKVFLVSAPNGLKPSNLQGGNQGYTLTPKKPMEYIPFYLYNVKSFEFEPTICPH